jgi:hypothetical protein
MWSKMSVQFVCGTNDGNDRDDMYLTWIAVLRDRFVAETLQHHMFLDADFLSTLHD